MTVTGPHAQLAQRLREWADYRERVASSQRLPETVDELTEILCEAAAVLERADEPGNAQSEIARLRQALQEIATLERSGPYKHPRAMARAALAGEPYDAKQDWPERFKDGPV